MEINVLVVEDDREINELLGEYLTLDKLGYLSATTGQAGIHLATTRRPDAIVLDLMLPDIDGYQVARTLTTQRATYDIPIVILSCMCQECDREKGFASGAMFFVNKPFLPDDLIATVRKALEWKAGLRARTPAGSFALGVPAGEMMASSRALNQMVADIFTHTDLPESAVRPMREAMELMGTWALGWNAEHKDRTRLNVDYRIQPAQPSPSRPACIEWKLSEAPLAASPATVSTTAPATPAPTGPLAEAFFKPVPPAPAPTGPGAVIGGVGGLIGWGSTAQPAKSAAPATLQPPPAKWLQILTKIGAPRFEPDPANRTVRFSRDIPAYIDGAGSAFATARSPIRLRDEPLATKGS